MATATVRRKPRRFYCVVKVNGSKREVENVANFRDNAQVYADIRNKSAKLSGDSTRFVVKPLSTKAILGKGVTA